MTVISQASWASGEGIRPRVLYQGSSLYQFWTMASPIDPRLDFSFS